MGFEPASILLVDDEPGIRKLLARALTAKGHRVVSLGAAMPVLALGEKLGDFDAAVIDYELPDLLGDELIQRLRRGKAHLCAVLISGERFERLKPVLVETPTSDFLPKPVAIGALLTAVHRAKADTATLRALMAGRRATEVSDVLEPQWSLTPRQVEVARLLVVGYTYKRIGAELSIEPETVQLHVKNMKHRIGVASRNELVDALRSISEVALSAL